MNTFRKVVALLSHVERRRGLVLLALVTFMGLFEALSIASVMPFLSVLGNPGVIETNPWLATAYDTLGFESTHSFVVALGVGAFALVVFSALYRAMTHYLMNRYIEMRRHTIGWRLLGRYLRQPYAFFLNRHSGEMAKNVLSEVDQFVNNFLRPATQLVSFSAVALAIVVLLVIVDPLLAAVVTLLFVVVYAGVYGGIRGLLQRIGRERVQANQSRFTTAGECLGGIKDVKLLARENAYLARYEGPSSRFSRHQATTQTLSELPVFAVEAIAFGGIILLTLFMIGGEGSMQSNPLGGLLPVLGLYAFAALRLKPAAQHIYRAIAQMRAGDATLNVLYRDLVLENNQALPTPLRPAEPLTPQAMIRLRDVHYHYPNAVDNALESIDVTIPVGSSLGIVGTTGAGKTTLVDVLLGLLRPTRGDIQVDETVVDDDRLRAWQSALGYVPQDIFLTDASVSENIAFGLPADEIDLAQVERCARMAQLHEFVVNEMPEGYDTIVGERGVRLSGGQRQRIGIARALYHDPEVLVFDEATSALDTVTERAVMESIDALHHQKTIILIAHRLTTVEHCDQVLLLDHGQIRAQGTYEALRDGDEAFRRMAASSG